MSHTNGSVKAILYALAANLGIALAKGFAAWLLVGLRRAKRPVSEDHPLGYGKAIYFWSFIVAVMLFSMGGVFSISMTPLAQSQSALSLCSLRSPSALK